MASPPRNATSLYTLTTLLVGMCVLVAEQHRLFVQHKIIDRPLNPADPLCQAVSNAFNSLSTAALFLTLLNQHLQKGVTSGT